jgi:hypothetical protein
MTRHALAVRASARLYRALLFLYPASFADEFGAPMVQAFRDLAEAAAAEGGLVGLLLVWPRVLRDLASSTAEQHRYNGPGRLDRWTVAGFLLCLPAVAFWASVVLDSFLTSWLGRWLVDAQALIPPAGQAGLWLGLPILGLLAAVQAARLDGRSALSLGCLAVNTLLVALVVGAATLRVS